MIQKPIAVLHVLTDRRMGGAGSWLSTLLREGNRTAFRYGVILPEGSAVIPRLPTQGVTLYRLPIREKSLAPADLPRYARAIADFRPDVLQTHGALTARLAALAAAPGAFCILTKHCVFESSRTKMPLFGRLSSALTAPFTHAALATAACAAETLVREGFPSARILTVPNGAAPLRVPCEQEKETVRRALGLRFPFTVGFCGRIEKDKNPFFLLRLADALRDDPRFGFLVIGDGSLLPSLKKAIAAVGLADRFCFTGQLSDVSLPLSLLDVQLNASLLSETTCMALLEGFSLGVPALVAPCGGNRETVRAGMNGLFYPANDARRCAERILYLAAHDAVRRRMGACARRIYREEYRGALMAARCESLYRALVTAKD